VGKSSIACQSSRGQRAAGYKTLVVDLDPQANSSHYLLGDVARMLDLTIAEFLSAKTCRPSLFNKKAGTRL